MSWPRVSDGEVPALSAGEMRQVDLDCDRLFHIGTARLMEIAGFQIARFVDGWLQGSAGRRVLVLAGSGNNGGDALVAARFLTQRGADIRCVTVPANDPAGLVANHEQTLRAMGIECEAWTGLLRTPTDLILDGLLGTGIKLPLREPVPALIAAANQSGTPIVSIDVPSGLDSETGQGNAAAMQAAATLTLGLPKPGLSSAPCSGRLFVADIGLPAALFGAQQRAVRELYRRGDLVEIVDTPQTPS